MWLPGMSTVPNEDAQSPGGWRAGTARRPGLSPPRGSARPLAVETANSQGFALLLTWSSYSRETSTMTWIMVPLTPFVFAHHRCISRYLCGRFTCPVHSLLSGWRVPHLHQQRRWLFTLRNPASATFDRHQIAVYLL